MSDSAAFDCVCTALEERTSLDRLEARGTVRLALKSAGLDVRSVSPQQMAVVVGKVLPGELTSRGVQDAESICGEIARRVSGLEAGAGVETPESVFQRLGG